MVIKWCESLSNFLSYEKEKIVRISGTCKNNGKICMQICHEAKLSLNVKMQCDNISMQKYNVA